MDLSNKLILDYSAKKYLTQIKKTSPIDIATEDFGWQNWRYASDVYSLAHVERYSDSKLEVLHVTTFPHAWSPEPIFGFDVIANEQTIIGCYMDLSPGITEYAFDVDREWSNRKSLPDWASTHKIFSDRFVLMKPKNTEEFIDFCDWSLEIYKWYIERLQQKVITSDVDLVIEKQNTYCKVQSTNPRTYSSLKSKIGEERATYFMKNVLFPEIPRKL